MLCVCCQGGPQVSAQSEPNQEIRFRLAVAIGDFALTGCDVQLQSKIRF